MALLQPIELTSAGVKSRLTPSLTLTGISHDDLNVKATWSIEGETALAKLAAIASGSEYEAHSRLITVELSVYPDFAILETYYSLVAMKADYAKAMTPEEKIALKGLPRKTLCHTLNTLLTLGSVTPDMIVRLSPVSFGFRVWPRAEYEPSALATIKAYIAANSYGVIHGMKTVDEVLEPFLTNINEMTSLTNNYRALGFEFSDKENGLVEQMLLGHGIGLEAPISRLVAVCAKK